VANFLICLFAAAAAAGRQWFLFHPNSKTGAESLGSTQQFPVLYFWVREWVKTMLTFNISWLGVMYHPNAYASSVFDLLLWLLKCSLHRMI